MLPQFKISVYNDCKQLNVSKYHLAAMFFGIPIPAGHIGEVVKV